MPRIPRDGDREQDQPAEGLPEVQRSASTPVLFDRKIPATQIVTALATHTSSSAQNGRCGSRFTRTPLAGKCVGWGGSPERVPVGLVAAGHGRMRPGRRELGG